MSSWFDRHLGWLLWPLKGFDQEFLRSDVIGNYSRPYSWQANQLGHATIGLTTTLIFAWMTEHLSSGVAIATRHYRQVLRDETMPLIGPFDNLAVYFFLALLIFPVLAILTQQFARYLARHAERRSNLALQSSLTLARMATRGLWLIVVLLGAMLIAFAFSIEFQRDSGDFTENLGHGAATVVIFVVSYLAVLMIMSKLFTRVVEFDDLPDRFFGRASYAVWRIMLIAGLGAGIALVVGLFAHAFGFWNDQEIRVIAQVLRRLETAAVVLVAVTFAALAALESRTPHYTLLSWLTIAAAVLMFDETTLATLARTDVFGVADAPLALGAALHAQAPLVFASCVSDSGALTQRDLLQCAESVSLSVIAALVLVTLVALMIVRVRAASIRWVMLAAFVFFVGLIFIASRSGYDIEAWRKAIAAVMTTLAVWWVKEFGNDIVRVDKGIDEAAAERKLNGYPDIYRGVTREDDVAPVVSEYRRDALADAFTDCLFYLTGAAIGAGILYAGYIEAEGVGLFDTAWRNLPATLGFAFFIGVYVGFGYSWTRRNDALDEIQVFQAYRFGVMESALKVDVFRGSQTAGAEQPVDRLLEVNSKNEVVHARSGAEKSLGSMQALLAFSRGGLRIDADAGDGENLTLEDVKHLVIAGRFGSGRTDLGNAMASEAALCNIPPLGRKHREKGLAKREARYFTLKNVLDLTEIDSSVLDDAPDSEMARNAGLKIKRDLRMRVGKPDVFVLNEADPFGMDVFEAFQAAEDRAPTGGAADQQQLEQMVEMIERPHDQVALETRSNLRRKVLTRALDQLEVEGLDQTVWIINADVERPNPASGRQWTPATPPAVTEYVNDLVYCLADRIRRAAIEAATRQRAAGKAPEEIPEITEDDVNVAVALIARRAHAIAPERM
ncbi:MAG: hypothetical protein AAFU68_05045 [Pseudomonadota bacterium]